MKVRGIEVDSDNYRKIAEIYFNKRLESDEVVHHIDGNRTNNNPENLVIMKRSQHSKLHVLFNFENWRKGQHILCSSCLYVRIYEDMKKGELPWNYEVLHSIAEKSIKGLRGDIFDEKIAKVFYNETIKWKVKNNHDCYRGY